MALKTNWPSVLPFGSDDKFDSFIHFSFIISRFFQMISFNSFVIFIRVLFLSRILGIFFLTVLKEILTSCKVSLILLLTIISYTTSLPFSSTFITVFIFFSFLTNVPSGKGHILNILLFSFLAFCFFLHKEDNSNEK